MMRTLIATLIASTICGSAVAAPNMMGAIAVPFSHLSIMNQWKDVLPQIESNQIINCNPCTNSQARVIRAIDGSKNLPLAEKLSVINTTVNMTIMYQNDSGEIWSAPTDTLQYHRGDCEDYAIVKMAALHAAGIDLKDMSILVVSEKGLNQNHAVLAVTDGEKNYILDIMTSKITLDTDSKYLPLYAVSESSGWIYGKQN